MRTIRHVGPDVQLLGNVLEFDRHRKRSREFRLPRHRDPKSNRDQHREQLPAGIVREEMFHGRSKLDSPTADALWVTAAEVRISLRSRRPVSNCSTRSSATSSSISENAAIEILPVSSDTTTAIQSDSSVIPSAARWRVPSSVISSGLVVSGRSEE